MIYPDEPWLEWSHRICPLGGVTAREQAQQTMSLKSEDTAKTVSLFLILNNISFGVVFVCFFPA